MCARERPDHPGEKPTAEDLIGQEIRERITEYERLHPPRLTPPARPAPEADPSAAVERLREELLRFLENYPPPARPRGTRLGRWWARRRVKADRRWLERQERRLRRADEAEEKYQARVRERLRLHTEPGRPDPDRYWSPD